VKEVVGTCVSMGITVEGKEPKDVISEIEKGIHDQHFKDEKSD
jgi:large subunit ribosomal protein L11